MDQKQKKINDLKNLLSQAKNRIQSLKATILDKEKQIENLKQSYQNKLKNLQQDEGQIMKQYQQRLIRYQKSLEDSDNLVAKYQKLSQTNSQNYSFLVKQANDIGNVISKIFSSTLNKQTNQAVEQLCSIQKCKDLQEKIIKIQNETPQLDQLIKSIKKLSSIYEDALKKKRQSRLLFIKKETALNKQLEEQSKQHSTASKTIEGLKQKLKQTEEDYQKKIQSIAKSKAKLNEEKTNLQFVKQLFIKVVLGPKEASVMAFQVLSKVLKFTSDEYKQCSKKISK